MDMKTLKDITQEIRNDLKANGITRQQVSVRRSKAGHNALDIELNDISITPSKVKEIICKNKVVKRGVMGGLILENKAFIYIEYSAQTIPQLVKSEPFKELVFKIDAAIAELKEKGLKSISLDNFSIVKLDDGYQLDHELINNDYICRLYHGSRDIALSMIQI
jgi:hypothetical protein